VAVLPKSPPHFLANWRSDNRRISDARDNFLIEADSLIESASPETRVAAIIQEVCKSPAMMLGRVAMGNPKRTQYQLQLEGAGPVELETAARQSIMTGDIVLTATVATIVDRPHKDRQPFSASALAADRALVLGMADPLTNTSLRLAQKSVETAST